MSVLAIPKRTQELDQETDPVYGKTGFWEKAVVVGRLPVLKPALAFLKYRAKTPDAPLASFPRGARTRG